MLIHTIILTKLHVSRFHRDYWYFSYLCLQKSNGQGFRRIYKHLSLSLSLSFSLSLPTYLSISLSTNVLAHIYGIMSPYFVSLPLFSTFHVSSTCWQHFVQRWSETYLINLITPAKVPWRNLSRHFVMSPIIHCSMFFRSFCPTKQIPKSFVPFIPRLHLDCLFVPGNPSVSLSTSSLCLQLHIYNSYVTPL